MPSSKRRFGSPVSVRWTDSAIASSTTPMALGAKGMVRDSAVSHVSAIRLSFSSAVDGATEHSLRCDGVRVRHAPAAPFVGRCQGHSLGGVAPVAKPSLT